MKSLPKVTGDTKQERVQRVTSSSDVTSGSVINHRPDAGLHQEAQEAINNSPRALKQRHDFAAALGGEMPDPNTTGLPDHLKSGLEALSGLDLSHIRVHFNSDKVTDVGAAAYAQGSHIHIGPGQEKCLPHEGWHVVQQMQRRVKPSLQMKNHAINHDAALEREADIMGARANQGSSLPQAQVQTVTGSTPLPPVIQRTPEEALASIKSNADKKEKDQKDAIIIDKIESIVHSIRGLQRIWSNENFNRTLKETYGPSLLKLLGSLTLSSEKRLSFIEQWNKDVEPTSIFFVPVAKQESKLEKDESLLNVKPQKTDSAPGGEKKDESTGKIQTQKAGAALENWLSMPLSNKSMTPTRKLIKFFDQSGARYDQLPQDFRVALRLFFAHTAEFNPMDKQGRDIAGKGSGGYFRTSKNAVKSRIKEDLKVMLSKTDPGFILDGRIVSLFNLPLFEALNGPTKLAKLEDMKVQKIKDIEVAIHKTAQGAGALGLPINVIKSLRMLERHDKDEHKLAFEDVTDELKKVTGKIDATLLQSQNKENYHDFLLQDRQKLIKTVSKLINTKGVQAKPVQSDEHPSLIIHDSDSKNVETWVNAFHSAARALGYNTHLNSRGSFGFLYPTISPVGGAVRVWPGLIPASIFQEIMEQTVMHVCNKGTGSSQMSRNSSALPSAKRTASKDNPLLHVEALRTAVRYTADVMDRIRKVPAVKQAYSWIVERLSKNLAKANFLLKIDEGFNTQKDKENHYLKTTLVIENLMEYTYLLQALVREGNVSPERHDPYPAQLASTLFPKSTSNSSSKPPDIETFYLDSGMQAIVAANLLAKAQIKAAKKKQTPPQVLDVNSYFEYATILRDLQLMPFDRIKSKRPDIIAIDLNPVFTSPEDAKKRNASQVLSDYQESKESGKTIPIIDITNSTLSRAAQLKLQERYENFIIVESLTKHQQLGSDKFTMGRLSAIGSSGFIKLAKQIISPISTGADDPLWMEYRLGMDRIFYGDHNKDPDHKSDSSAGDKKDTVGKTQT